MDTTWEESTRVPIVIAGPGVNENKECHTPVSLIDLYPTLLDYCNLPGSPNSHGNNRNWKSTSPAQRTSNNIQSDRIDTDTSFIAMEKRSFMTTGMILSNGLTWPPIRPIQY